MKIVILGAGISGLSLGWFLKKKYKDDLELIILEKNANSGGYIKTIKKGGFLFELGCRSCRTRGNGIKTLQLIEDLELENEVITAESSAQNRYIYKNQKLEMFPRGIYSFLKSPLMKGMVRALCRDFFGKSKPLVNDESIYEFMKRRFSQDFAENLFDPLTSGIYAGDISKLSLKSCFPILYDFDIRFGSVIKGMMFNKKSNENILSPFVKKLKRTSMFSFKGGMQTLTHALSAKLKDHIKYDSKIKSIKFLENGVAIQLEGEGIVMADQVFSTIPPQKVSPLINDHELKSALNQFSSTSIATVSFGFNMPCLKENGFGYLIPSKEKQKVLGVVFDSAVFKDQNQLPDETRLTVMIGGAHMQNFDHYKEEDFLKMALEALCKHLRISEVPDSYHVEILKNAIPQYLVGHSERLALVEALSPVFFKILGSSFYGVSVNDCIAISKLHAEMELPLQKNADRKRIKK